MKQINHRVIIASLVVGGLFIGIVKGQEARNRWVTKMRSRYENNRPKSEKKSPIVDLDDFEISSFHRN